MLHNFFLLLCLIVLSACSAPTHTAAEIEVIEKKFQELFLPDLQKTIKDMQKTQRLWSFSGLHIHSNTSITLDVLKKNGRMLRCKNIDGSGITIDFEIQKKITLLVGNDCVDTDGRHDFLTYRLDKIENRQATFTVIAEHRFNGLTAQASGTITLSPYLDN